LLSRAVGEELLKEDTEVVMKLKAEPAEAISSLNSALAANNHLGLENETAKGKISVLKKSIEDLRAKNDLL